MESDQELFFFSLVVEEDQRGVMEFQSFVGEEVELYATDFDLHLSLCLSRYQITDDLFAEVLYE
jgi:hypothetical protein